MLYYKIHNLSKNHNQNLPCLVFLAGFTGTCDTWNALITELLKHNGYQILLIDNLGAGKSSQPQELYNTQQMAELILEVICTLKINKIYLFGHSLGGAIAQHVALKNPELIQHLFLLSSFIKLDNIARLFLISRCELHKSNMNKKIIASNTIPSLFADSFLSVEDNQQIAIQRIIDNPQTIYGMLGQLNACLTHDTSEIIADIKCNVSLITGNEDILVNSKHSKLLHANIHDSKLHEIPETGHMRQLEQPQKLANIIIDTINYYI